MLACTLLAAWTFGCAGAESQFEGRWSVDIQATHQAAQDTIGQLSYMPVSELRNRLEGLSLAFSSQGEVVVAQGGRSHTEQFGIRRYKNNLYRLWITDGPRREALTVRLTDERLWILQGMDVIALERK